MAEEPAVGGGEFATPEPFGVRAVGGDDGLDGGRGFEEVGHVLLVAGVGVVGLGRRAFLGAADEIEAGVGGDLGGSGEGEHFIPHEPGGAGEWGAAAEDVWVFEGGVQRDKPAGAGADDGGALAVGAGAVGLVDVWL